LEADLVDGLSEGWSLGEPLVASLAEALPEAESLDEGVVDDDGGAVSCTSEKSSSAGSPPSAAASATYLPGLAQSVCPAHPAAE